MADNIFDAQRDRRIAVLQQQSVSNLVKANPNLRGVLTRYEDAEVSRIKLLELQQMRSKKITAGEKALLATLRKGRRATGGKGGRQKKDKVEPPKSQTQIEVDAEEKRAKVKQEEKKLRQQDRFLELEDYKQQREFVSNQRNIQQRDLQRLDTFTSGQNRLIAEADIARQGRLETARLAGADRGQRQIQFEAQQRQQLEIEDRSVVRSEAERDARMAESDNQLRGVQERVGRDDAFRHAQLQETQRLALAQLASQQRDNEFRHQEQQLRIDNQRAVDADRAVTDRELIGGLQGRITQLERQQFPPGQGKVEDVSLARPEPAPEPQPEPTLSSQPIVAKPSKQRLVISPASSAPPTPQLKRGSPGAPGVTPLPSSVEPTLETPSLQSVDTGSTRNLRSSTPPRQSTTRSTPAEEALIAQAYRSNTPPRATRSQSPEVYKPQVKTLEEVRKENPVEGGGE